MTLKKTSRKHKEIKILRIAGEHWLHRRHHKAKTKTKTENYIEKKQLLQQILDNEHNEEIKKYEN